MNLATTPVRFREPPTSRAECDTISYILAGLAAANYPPDAATDALARYLRNSQGPDGGWRIAASEGSRPPIESSKIEVTAISMRALQVYAPSTQRTEYQKAVQLANGPVLASKPAGNGGVGVFGK